MAILQILFILLWSGALKSLITNRNEYAKSKEKKCFNFSLFFARAQSTIRPSTERMSWRRIRPVVMELC